MTLDEHLKHRGKMLKNLPMSDVRQIIAFETIVRNYLKMDWVEVTAIHQDQ